MKVLAACEESQEVCKAFRILGHEAYSCDIQEPTGGHPEWHILGDAFKAIGGVQIITMDGQAHDVGRWDMIIAFPPCTKTSNAGARHLYRGGKLNIKRYYEGLCGKALFLAIWAADCEKVVIENPTPSKVFEYPEPTQAIQPYQYGHPFSKKTLLWARGGAAVQGGRYSVLGTQQNHYKVQGVSHSREPQRNIYLLAGRRKVVWSVSSRPHCWQNRIPDPRGGGGSVKEG